MTPYAGRCKQCGETTMFDNAPEEWKTPAGQWMRLLSAEHRVQVMRQLLRNLPCFACGGEQVIEMFEEA